MKTNITVKTATTSENITHEGAPASRITKEQALRRSVLACMLWEDTFYEDGVAIADRITDLVQHVEPEKVANIAIEAREAQKLRHAPLWLVRAMAKSPEHKTLVGDTLARVIQRPDELTEFLSLYWKTKREKLANQVKKGLSQAFTKFNAYQLAKYNRDAPIKLRDVMFLTHPKPQDKEQEKVWKQLVNGTLASPDTWEVALSSGADKKETFERLIKEGKLGAMAFLRNLRNMQEAGVDKAFIKEHLKDLNVERVLPYRFIAAARYAPTLESALEELMVKCLDGHEKLEGRTALLVDVSGSMDSAVSGKSELTRIDAACGLAILLREICSDVDVYTFSDRTVEVAGRRGFALRDAIAKSQAHSGTNLGAAVSHLNSKSYDRVIVITDEQSHDRVPNPATRGYVINVAAYKNGVGYDKWVHIDGWSEAVIDYIQSFEKLDVEAKKPRKTRKKTSSTNK